VSIMSNRTKRARGDVVQVSVGGKMYEAVLDGIDTAPCTCPERWRVRLETADGSAVVIVAERDMWEPKPGDDG